DYYCQVYDSRANVFF
nr:immunoglobulin light chain junction region [Macaca mulatta]MOX28531.1 immunoglobulin light chain junction region [Macaca mulatta]MOX29370.1 immunoglobulin light chain junction region [Macaca mulatta]MOX29480.1 immunoglobulin light chain junction region [Macaca mulatta]MOX29760.1 immunoglobulin light chain junction region [Macaca mulatta]